MVVRLQALYALSYCGDKNFREAVGLGFDDLYEMIRRQSAHFSGKIGDPVYAEKIFKTVETGLEVQRVQYASETALTCLAYFAKESMSGYPVPGFYFNFRRDNYEYDPNYKTDMSDKGAKSEIRFMRNYPAHYQYKHLLATLGDANADKTIRLYIAEALGWFHYSMYRKELADGLKEILAANPTMEADLKDEIVKSINRISFKIR